MTSRPPIIYYTLCYTLYTLEFILYTIDYILYTWSIDILEQDHSKEAIKLFTHHFGPCGSPTIAYYSSIL